MSLTKQWIEKQMSQGNDVLHPEHLDEQYCYYSGLPSPAAYKKVTDDESTDYTETA